MKLVLATIQTPFIYGGAEYLITGLTTALQAGGHAVERISMPFRFAPIEEVRRAMDIWSSENFEILNGHQADRVICLQFPAYYVQHPRKVLWLLHQYRAVYDLWETPFAQYSASDPQAGNLRDLVVASDNARFPESSPRYTIAANVSARLSRYNGISSSPLYHPPFDADRFYSAETELYVFAPSRLEQAKRQDLLVRAIAETHRNIIALIAGEGGQQDRLRQLVAELDLQDRVHFLGRISEEEKRAFYAHALCVFFGPYDEDYGYVTLEAMLSCRPVITCTDSGGPLEFVTEDTGVIVAPHPTEIARAIEQLAENRRLAQELGAHGRQRYSELNISWTNVVEKLTATDTASR